MSDYFSEELHPSTRPDEDDPMVIDELIEDMEEAAKEAGGVTMHLRPSDILKVIKRVRDLEGLRDEYLVYRTQIMKQEAKSS